MPTTIISYDHYKRFLDETADRLRNLKTKEVEELYENLIKTISEQDSVEIIEEIFAFCSASVPEMIQSAKGSLLKIFEQRNSFKVYSNFHVLISSVVSTVVKAPVSDFADRWIELLLESVISGLTAIESETISLSGSSLIKLLKWEEIKMESNDISKVNSVSGVSEVNSIIDISSDTTNVTNTINVTYASNTSLISNVTDTTIVTNTANANVSLCEKLSKKLADHPDFVVILTADMCAMFSRIEEVDSAPFLRIVRFCELLINVSDDKSGLMNKIVDTVEKEFIKKVYRTTLKTISNKTLPFKWSNELLKVCHRGNELVKPLVGEVFKIKSDNFIKKFDFTENFDFAKNFDFIEILSNEKSRKIPEIVQILFSSFEGTETTTTTTNTTATTPTPTTLILSESDDGPVVIDDEYYKATLINRLESFEMFKIENFKNFNSVTSLGISLFKCNRLVLLNWLPYVMKLVKIESKSTVVRLHMDISKKLNEFLEL